MTTDAALAVPLVAFDPDGDPLSFAVDGLSAGTWRVDAGPAEAGRVDAVLRWVPPPWDARGGGAYEARVTVQDGRGGQASRSFSVTVRPAHGPPRVELPKGLTLDLALTEALVVPVTVVDPDSETVGLSLEEAPAGATLQATGPKSALLRWRPDAVARATRVHPFVLRADDGVHPAVDHALSVVLLRRDGGDTCTGRPPTVRLEGAEGWIDAGLGTATLPGDTPTTLTLTVDDPDGRVDRVRLHHRRDDAALDAPEDVAARPATAVDAEPLGGGRWRASLDPTAAGPLPEGGALIRAWWTAEDDDDPGLSRCDRVARWPTTRAGPLTGGTGPLTPAWVWSAAPASTPAFVCRDDGQEPDDTVETARPLSVGHDGRRRLCGDEDHARVTLQPSETLLVRLTAGPGQGTLELAITSPEGAELETAAVTGAGAEGSATLQVSNDGQAPEDVVVRVREAAPEVGALPLERAYSLDTHVARWACPADDPWRLEATSPVPTLEGVGEAITSPGAATVWVAEADRPLCAGQRSRLRVTLGPGERVLAEVAAAWELGTVALWAVDADAPGRRLALDEGAGGLATVVWQAPQDAGATVELVAQATAVGSAQTLGWRVARWPAGTVCSPVAGGLGEDDRFGPTATASAARQAPPGLLSGLKACPGRPDWARATVGPGQTWRVRVSPAPGQPPVAPELALYVDPEAEPAAVAGDPGPDGTREAVLGPKALAELAAQPGGVRVFARVAAPPGGGGVAYTWQDTLTHPVPCEADGLEPNGREVAGAELPVVSNGVATGLGLCAEGGAPDVDRVRIVAPAGGTLWVATRREAGATGFADLRVEDADGVELGAATDTGEGAELVVPLDSGGLLVVEVVGFEVDEVEGLAYSLVLQGL